MQTYLLPFIFTLLASTQLLGQVDFYRQSITGQSPNSATQFFVLGLSRETSVVSNATNLNEFDHVSRQINLFNLGVGYATQVLGIDTLEAIRINLDTVIGGSYTKSSFRFFGGMKYLAWDREAHTTLTMGSSRFQEGGFSMGLRQEISIIPKHQTIELIPATVTDQSLFASFYAGVEAGFDTGFSVSLEESGVLEHTTHHLIRDVAAEKLTFDQYKTIEEHLHTSLKYQAPKNMGGSEFYFLTTLKGQIHIKPSKDLRLRLALGAEGGIDVVRIGKRNQNRFAVFLKAAYYLI